MYSEGVYVTRNKDKYHYGRMWLNYNKAFNNGINGLVVHKTDRAQVIGNVLWDNGKVPKSEPESRQPYAGLTLNYAVDVEVKDNYVKTEDNTDYAYMAVSGSVISGSSGNNKVRRERSVREIQHPTNDDPSIAELQGRLPGGNRLRTGPVSVPVSGLHHYLD